LKSFNLGSRLGTLNLSRVRENPADKSGVSKLLPTQSLESEATKPRAETVSESVDKSIIRGCQSNGKSEPGSKIKNKLGNNQRTTQPEKAITPTEMAH
jgi:hypothetical protein